MLKELFDAFVGVVEKSTASTNKLHFLPRPYGLNGEGMLVDPEGHFDHLPPAIPPRTHGLRALAEMKTAIRWAALKANAAAAAIPRAVSASGETTSDSTELSVVQFDPLRLSVWHNEDGAVLVMNDNGPRSDLVTLTLTTTDIWDLLCELYRNKTKCDHREFMSLMRFQLCPYMEPVAAAALLEAAKVIDFGTNANGTSAQSRNQSGFGMNVESTVKSRAGELKDEIVVMVPIYNDALLSERVPVRLSLEVNPVNKSFEVRPVIDELPKAMAIVMQTMRDTLEHFANADGSQMAFVFYGSVDTE